MKPIAQIAMVEGVLKAVGRGTKRDTAIQRLNLVDWRMTPAGYWENILVNPNNTINKNEEMKALSAALIAYLVGSERMKKDDVSLLKREYNRARGAELSTAVSKLPHKLPTPVTNK